MTDDNVQVSFHTRNFTNASSVMVNHCPYLFMTQRKTLRSCDAKTERCHQELKQLLLHQFLQCSRNPQSSQSPTESCRDLEMAVEHTRLLLALNKQDACANKVVAVTTQVDQLREQVTKLTKQVAAPSNTTQNDARKLQQPPRRCFSCSCCSHFQHDCPLRHQESASHLCYTSGWPGYCSTISGK